MATRRKRTANPVIIDIPGFAGAAVMRLAPEDYRPMYGGKFVDEHFYATAAEAEAPAIKAWVVANPKCSAGSIVSDPAAWVSVSA